MSPVGNIRCKRGGAGRRRDYGYQFLRFIVTISETRIASTGGLGNVWLANDLELNRKVAVKEIKSKYTASEIHRLRFSREALITSRLEHPGILPVYGMGHLTNGTPYYAMQFVNGRNFREVIAEFHAGVCARDGKRSLVFRRLIKHFLDVCNTVNYAHAKGVVHRDIKPENIMIGQFGETFLVDWGLAKTTEPEPANSKGINQPNDNGLTSSLDGRTIGSPAFMSPEQSGNEPEQTGPLSDVYSLGATLLSLITNTDNPNGIRTSDTAENQVAGNPLLASDLNPLVSICQKAMSIEPANRYESPGELIEDVENFLLERPVVAHRESYAERITRLSRRYRNVLNTALAAFVLIAGVAVFSAFWVNSERHHAIAAQQSETRLRQHAETALVEEAAARAEADRRTEQLTDTVGIFADLFSGSDDAGLRLDLEKVTLQDGLLELDQRVTDDENGRLVKAFVNVVVARNRKGTGHYDEAIEYYEQALRLLSDDGIAESDSLYVDFLVGLCTAHSAAGNISDAKKIADRVVSICRNSPDRLQRAYFNALLAQSKTASRQGRLLDAKQLALEACDIGRRVYATIPDDNNLLWAKYVLADIHRQLGDPDSASQAFQEIIAALKSKESVHPLGFSSTIQIAEIQIDESPVGALELVESAYADACSYFGASHPDAIKIKARWGSMLTTLDDADSKNRGIVILEECRNQQIEVFGRDNYEVLGATWLLANALLGIQDRPHRLRAVEIIEESLEGIGTNLEVEVPVPAILAALTESLATAHEILGDIRNALDAMRTSLEWHREAFGNDSPRTTAIQSKLERLAKLAELQ